MELQYLQLQTTPAKVREIDTLGLYKMKGNRGEIPIHTWMFEYTTPKYLNAPSNTFTVQDINKAANLLKEQIYSTVMTPDYTAEFQINNFSNGDAVSTKKFKVNADTIFDIATQVVYEYDMEIVYSREDHINNMLSNKFYITVYFTYNGDRNVIGLGDDDGLCFWHCIEHIIALPLLKKLYGELKPVNITEIPDIESKLRIKINVESEVREAESYKSKKKYQKEVNLVLTKKDGEFHYELKHDPRKGHGNRERRFDKEEPIIVYTNTQYYDGNEIKEYDKKLPKKYHTTSLKVVERMFKRKGEKQKFTLEKAYELYNNACKNIKEWSKGKFNLFRYRTLNSFIRDTHYHAVKEYGFQKKMEMVKEYELNPLEESSKGALMQLKSKTEIYENGFQYDMKSSYPYSMIHKLFKFPITCGKQKTIDPKYFETNIKNKDLRYGQYYCKPIFPKHKTYFIKGSYNWFTHFDLIAGYDQGIRFELINEPNNCIYWLNNDLLQGDIFKKYIMYFINQKMIQNVLLLNVFYQVYGVLYAKQNINAKK